MALDRISILGVGLLGGSIGLAVHEAIKGCGVVGYGHRRSTLETALAIGAVDEICEDVGHAVRHADLVLLCTPVGIFQPILEAISSVVAPGTVVTDVGSTKRTVVRVAERCLPAGVHFVASHPMAGSEKRGIQFARADLFRDARCIVTPSEQTNGHALEMVESFWKRLGMRIVRLTPEEHDQRLADISHLPHALAAALIAGSPEASLALAARGFTDLTRIASGDGGLWRDILLDNRDNVRASIDRLKRDLDQVAALLEPDRAEALREWLDKAADRRHRLLDAPHDNG